MLAASPITMRVCRARSRGLGRPKTLTAGLLYARVSTGSLKKAGNRIGKIMTAGAITEFSASSLMSRAIGGFSLVRGTYLASVNKSAP